MKYINLFKTHASYEEKLNGGWVDISLPNVSYCEDIKDVHYNPYNTIEFYVGKITTPQTVKIYTGSSTSVDIEVSEGNKWYTYVLPKNKELYKIEGDSVKKVVVKTDINYHGAPFYYGTKPLIPSSTVEASFKGSNTSKVTNIESMFYDCSGLTSLDLSSFNTSNVTMMYNMFSGCNSLTSLDVSNFNTSNLINMNSMFKGCSGLASLDVSNFDTSNVTNMYGMFSGCNSLTSLDLSNFDTSNVLNMNDMFSGCNSLTSLDLSRFNISKVTMMYNMFNGCNSLTSLDLSSFNTSNVTHMSNMFNGCTNLTSLDLSKWDTSKVVNTTDMFSGCTSLRTITMVGCTPETRTKIEEVLTAAGIKDNVTIVTE